VPKSEGAERSVDVTRGGKGGGQNIKVSSWVSGVEKRTKTYDGRECRARRTFSEGRARSKRRGVDIVLKHGIARVRWEGTLAVMDAYMTKDVSLGKGGAP